VKSRRKVGPPEPTLEAVLGVHYPPPRKFFRDLRAKYDLTQKQIAGRLSVAEDTWARWEAERQFPHLLMYAGVLAVSKAWTPRPAGQRRRNAGRR